MEEVIKTFLEDEITDQELYNGIIDFVYSSNIRSGEYECNRFVIHKMDHLNYITYEEYASMKKGKRKIFNSFAVNRGQLIGLINEHAIEQGLKIKEL